MLGKFINKLEKLSTKWLIVLIIVPFALMILLVRAYLCDIFNLVISLLIGFLLSFVMGCSLVALVLPMYLCTVIKEQERVLEKLKEQLSCEEFTKVQFEPYNSNSRNIQKCLRILKRFEVTDFAKIGDGYNIIVIARDANGNQCDYEEIDATRFERNYKVLK